MSVGAWVVLLVVVFVIGNVMALKPKASEVRLGQMRLFARQIGLVPKLIPTPEFLKTPNAPKMMASYTLIDDAWRLPLGEFLAKDGYWQNFGTSSPNMSSQSIDNVLSLYFYGLTTKSNSISLYWHDDAYVKSHKVRDDTVSTKIQTDLNALKDYLSHLAQEMSA